MHQVGVLFAISVQLDHNALQLNCLLMSLAAMEHIQIQRVKICVAYVQKDSSVQILLSLQCPVKMEPLASPALLNVLFVQQGTGMKIIGLL